MIIVCCWIPASGKSHWARAFALKEWLPYFNPDLLCDMLFHIPWNPRYNTKDFTLQVVELWRKEHGMSPIIIDATFTTRKSRKALMERFPNDNIEWHFFDTPLEVCLERNVHRKNSVPESLIRSMFQTLERPSEKEAIYHIYH